MFHCEAPTSAVGTSKEKLNCLIHVKVYTNGIKTKENFQGNKNDKFDI